MSAERPRRIKITRFFLQFIADERTGGLFLLLAASVSIAIANSGFGPAYINFWHYRLDFSFVGLPLRYSIAEWINDGLMTVFFLLVGLEIERELYKGELSGTRNALLPVFAAIGGMILPACIHLTLNAGTPTQSGFGIPVATDIAFSLGVLSLLGRRVPVSLKVFLTALAIIDDLGAIIVIAFFYARNLSYLFLAAGLAVFATMLILNRLKVYKIAPYLVGGILMWLFMLKSGVHPTITGVLLAFAIPFQNGDKSSPSTRVLRFLNRPVPFLVIPVFVLANTAMGFSHGWDANLITHNTLGVFAGLVLGKPAGILFFSMIAVKSGLCGLPQDINWKHVGGIGILGGVGFTMSIFKTNLAFTDIRLC